MYMYIEVVTLCTCVFCTMYLYCSHVGNDTDEAFHFTQGDWFPFAKATHSSQTPLALESGYSFHGIPIVYRLRKMVVLNIVQIHTYLLVSSTNNCIVSSSKNSWKKSRGLSEENDVFIPGSAMNGNCSGEVSVALSTGRHPVDSVSCTKSYILYP